ncbi:MAG: sugar ABC transporter permease [Anaerolineae bacterium]|nr:sugar ABC transporter permease [Anaerolineae bacterium]
MSEFTSSRTTNVENTSTAVKTDGLGRSTFAKPDASTRIVLLIPAILIVLFLSIFPLIISLFLSFARVTFVRGGIDAVFVGFSNYQKLLFGSQQRHLIGKLGELSPLSWLFFFAIVALLLYWFYTGIRTNPRLGTIITRTITVCFAAGLLWIILSTLSADGIPGTMIVTLIFVVVGVVLQYLIGLGLALLLVQQIPGKRFFRIAFLLPMMITPVGIAFLFRMVTDTHVGPFVPLWLALGLKDFSFVESAAGARVAVIIGDVWQWTPFMFIILLAALEGTSRDTVEAALVDGAARLQLFRYVILPQIAPVSLTVILIRLIEAFKIIDIPRILTGGGPGTATESLTLHAYIEWRSPNLGGSAAISYLLLILVTFVAMLFVNVVRQQIIEKL